MKTERSSLLSLVQYGPFKRESQRQIPWRTVFLVALAACLFVAGRWSAPAPARVQSAVAELELEIMRQRETLERLSREQQNDTDALAARLAELTANSTRLDALGERLVQLGKLDPEEFAFGSPPPVGGPETVVSGGRSGAADLKRDIGQLSQVLHSQFARLDALQLLLLDKNLEKERTPSGWPVSSGWISSDFGERNDPFTGKRVLHEGLDFAGTKGSEILAVASGVVIWSGPKQGYGKLLEVDHGNGYVTRYAHNQEILVKAGERVRNGQVIARMGATGRASAPHVHFEVVQKGRAVNPWQFVGQAR